MLLFFILFFVLVSYAAFQGPARCTFPQSPMLSGSLLGEVARASNLRFEVHYGLPRDPELPLPTDSADDSQTGANEEERNAKVC